jgi:hypothetical protein
MRSGGGSFGRIGLHVGADAGSTTVTFSIADRKVDDSALEFARELARQAAGFAAEVERLHAQHSPDSRTGEVGAGSGEAA